MSLAGRELGGRVKKFIEFGTNKPNICLDLCPNCLQ